MHALSLGAYFTDGHISRGRSGHSHHSHHTHRSAEHDQHRRDRVGRMHESHAGGGIANQGSLKQLLVNQIRVSLSQRFDLQQSSITVAGATPDEQASSDLAGTVSAALNSANTSSPTEAVAAVNDTAGGAIQQTSQDIAAGNAAATPNSLDSAIAQIQDQLQSLFSAYLDQAGSSQAADAVTASGAKLISNAQGQLEIHTREGDTITLSFASKSGVSVQNLQAGGGAAQLSTDAIQAFGQNGLTISVQGDLNDAELQAVQDLMGRVNQLADAFFGGDVDAALSQAGGLGFDNSQLTDYSLHLALQQTFAAYGLNLALPPASTADKTSTVASNSGGSTTNGTTPSTANDGTATTTKAAVAA